jgi:hypothetical protein
MAKVEKISKEVTITVDFSITGTDEKLIAKAIKDIVKEVKPAIKDCVNKNCSFFAVKGKIGPLCVEEGEERDSK